MSNTKQVIISLIGLFSILTGILFLFTGEYWITVSLLSVGAYCVFIMTKVTQSVINQLNRQNVSRETSEK